MAGAVDCVVKVLPPTSLISVTNRCMTISETQTRTLKVFKPLGRNILEISGTMPLGDKSFTGYVAFTHPAEMFMDLLRQRLLFKNIVLTGKVRFQSDNILPQVPIATLESPPFNVIAAQTMKPSQNMFTETILWTLGEQFGRQSSPTADSSTLGIIAVKEWMKQIGIPTDAVIQYDGSGMSRHDLVTPSAVVTLYSYMAKQSKYKQVWLDSLTVGGVDGTLKRTILRHTRGRKHSRQDRNVGPGFGAVRLPNDSRRRTNSGFCNSKWGAGAAYKNRIDRRHHRPTRKLYRQDRSLK